MAAELGKIQGFIPDILSLPSSTLLDAIAELKDNPFSPELVTNFWQTFLESSIKRRGLDIPLPVVSCDRTSEGLEALEKEEKMWVPETKLSYLILGKIFPNTNSETVQAYSPIKDEYKQNVRGVDVEANIYSPNRNTAQKDLKKLFKSQGRKGMRLSTFILASQANKLLTNHYFDDDSTWSLLLGSHDKAGLVVCARFFGWHGDLCVQRDHYPQNPSSNFGGRSEGVKKS